MAPHYILTNFIWFYSKKKKNTHCARCSCHAWPKLPALTARLAHGAPTWPHASPPLRPPLVCLCPPFFFSLGSQYHLISTATLWFSLSLGESVTPPLTPSLFLSSPFLSFSQSPFQFFFQFYSESMTHFTTLVVYFSHFLLCWFLFFMLIVILFVVLVDN